MIRAGRFFARIFPGGYEVHDDTRGLISVVELPHAKSCGSIKRDAAADVAARHKLQRQQEGAAK